MFDPAHRSVWTDRFIVTADSKPGFLSDDVSGSYSTALDNLRTHNELLTGATCCFQMDINAIIMYANIG